MSETNTSPFADLSGMQEEVREFIEQAIARSQKSAELAKRTAAAGWIDAEGRDLHPRNAAPLSLRTAM